MPTVALLPVEGTASAAGTGQQKRAKKSSSSSSSSSSDNNGREKQRRRRRGSTGGSSSSNSGGRRPPRRGGGGSGEDGERGGGGRRRSSVGDVVRPRLEENDYDEEEEEDDSSEPIGEIVAAADAAISAAAVAVASPQELKFASKDEGVGDSSGLSFDDHWRRLFSESASNNEDPPAAAVADVRSDVNFELRCSGLRSSGTALYTIPEDTRCSSDFERSDYERSDHEGENGNGSGGGNFNNLNFDGDYNKELMHSFNAGCDPSWWRKSEQREDQTDRRELLYRKLEELERQRQQQQQPQPQQQNERQREGRRQTPPPSRDNGAAKDDESSPDRDASPRKSWGKILRRSKVLEAEEKEQQKERREAALANKEKAGKKKKKARQQRRGSEREDHDRCRPPSVITVTMVEIDLDASDRTSGSVANSTAGDDQVPKTSGDPNDQAHGHFLEVSLGDASSADDDDGDDEADDYEEVAPLPKRGIRNRMDSMQTLPSSGGGSVDEEQDDNNDDPPSQPPSKQIALEADPPPPKGPSWARALPEESQITSEGPSKPLMSEVNFEDDPAPHRGPRKEKTRSPKKGRSNALANASMPDILIHEEEDADGASRDDSSPPPESRLKRPPKNRRASVDGSDIPIPARRLLARIGSARSLGDDREKSFGSFIAGQMSDSSSTVSEDDDSEDEEDHGDGEGGSEWKMSSLRESQLNPFQSFHSREDSPSSTGRKGALDRLLAAKSFDAEESSSSDSEEEEGDDDFEMSLRESQLNPFGSFHSKASGEGPLSQSCPANMARTTGESRLETFRKALLADDGEGEGDAKEDDGSENSDASSTFSGSNPSNVTDEISDFDDCSNNDGKDDNGGADNNNNDDDDDDDKDDSNIGDGGKGPRRSDLPDPPMSKGRIVVATNFDPSPSLGGELDKSTYSSGTTSTADRCYSSGASTSRRSNCTAFVPAERSIGCRYYGDGTFERGVEDDESQSSVGSAARSDLGSCCASGSGLSGSKNSSMGDDVSSGSDLTIGSEESPPVRPNNAEANPIGTEDGESDNLERKPSTSPKREPLPRRGPKNQKKAFDEAGSPPVDSDDAEANLTESTEDGESDDSEIKASPGPRRPQLRRRGSKKAKKASQDRLDETPPDGERRDSKDECKPTSDVAERAETEDSKRMLRNAQRLGYEQKSCDTQEDDGTSAEEAFSPIVKAAEKKKIEGKSTFSYRPRRRSSLEKRQSLEKLQSDREGEARPPRDDGVEAEEGGAEGEDSVKEEVDTPAGERCPGIAVFNPKHWLSLSVASDPTSGKSESAGEEEAEEEEDSPGRRTAQEEFREGRGVKKDVGTSPPAMHSIKKTMMLRSARRASISVSKKVLDATADVLDSTAEKVTALSLALDPDPDPDQEKTADGEAAHPSYFVKSSNERYGRVCSAAAVRSSRRMERSKRRERKRSSTGGDHESVATELSESIRTESSASKSEAGDVSGKTRPSVVARTELREGGQTEASIVKSEIDIGTRTEPSADVTTQGGSPSVPTGGNKCAQDNRSENRQRRASTTNIEPRRDVATQTGSPPVTAGGNERARDDRSENRQRRATATNIDPRRDGRVRPLGRSSGGRRGSTQSRRVDDSSVASSSGGGSHDPFGRAGNEQPRQANARSRARPQRRHQYYDDDENYSQAVGEGGSEWRRRRPAPARAGRQRECHPDHDDGQHLISWDDLDHAIEAGIHSSLQELDNRHQGSTVVAAGEGFASRGVDYYVPGDNSNVGVAEGGAGEVSWDDLGDAIEKGLRGSVQDLCLDVVKKQRWKPPDRGDDGPWTCAACTYRNEKAGALGCGVCGRPRN